MFHSRSRFIHFDLRKPRHPLVKLGFGLVGVALLSVLLVFGLFAGAAMLAAGVVWRLAVQLRAPQQQQAVRGGAIDGEFRVVRKSDPMLSR
ncbi:hypothetical protein [Coralloluteibacterium stylophorae]|uniref:Transmembrane protein n=1 Tax=Coralloluteibacterium stylophorae TaxID=1776034 RepID=A0A8J7VWX5_9GAMM|nr:hypothetical protein [Coralloluteibacterium stylophorae]MBS7458358.1 hypothetical protein [Coralloluteibacterium stylophorae]